jgi:hypothetical protein
MKTIVWAIPLLIAGGLAAQEVATVDAEEPAPIEEAKVSPFWENEEKAPPVDPWSTVTPPPKPSVNDPPGPPIPLMVQMMVFRTEDPSVGLDAMAGGREAEPALFARLLAMEEEGTASMVMEHQIMTVGGRAASTSLIRTAGYGTEFEPLTNPMRLYPTAFEHRSVGDSSSVTPRFRKNDMHLLAQVAAVRWARPTRLPVLDLSQPRGPDRTMFCLQPHILVDECRTTAVVKPHETRWLGMTTEARPADDTTSAPASRFSFLRAVPIDDTTPPAGESRSVDGQGVRCDVVVFRIPVDEAAAWLWQPGPRDDAAAWNLLMAKAKTGEVKVADQWTVAATTGPVHPGGPPEASVSSFGELIYPTEHEGMIPNAFETRNTGTSCGLRLRAAADGRTLVGKLEALHVKLDHFRRWPCSTDDPDACHFQPEFSKWELSTDLVVPGNGIAFLGLRDATSFGATGDDTAVMADLYFLKFSGDTLHPPAEAPNAPAVVEWRSLVFSVDDAAVAELREVLGAEVSSTENDPGEMLWRMAADGRAHIRHTAAVVVPNGGSGSLTNHTEVVYPMAHRSRNEIVHFYDYRYQDTGLRLIVKPMVDAAQQTVTAVVEMAWASAPPQMPELAAYREALDAGVRDRPIPEFFDMPEEGHKTQVTLASGTSRLLRLEKARAPTGSPEHGRWHAVLVSAGIRGVAR